MLASKKRFGAREIAVIGLLMGMDIILSRFIAIETPITRITFGFLPTALIGILYGPWIAGTAAALTDLLGIVLFNRSGMFFIGFTLSAFAGGFIYGLFLHKKEIKLWRVIAAVLSITIFVNLIMNTVWIVIMYEEAWRGILPLRILQNAVVAPIRVLLIYFVAKNPSLRRVYMKFSTAKN